MGHVTVANGTFTSNQMESLRISNLKSVSFRLSSTDFRASFSKFSNSSLQFLSIDGKKTVGRFYTWETTFKSIDQRLASTKENFLDKAISNKFIQITPCSEIHPHMVHHETPFASGNVSPFTSMTTLLAQLIAQTVGSAS